MFRCRAGGFSVRARSGAEPQEADSSCQFDFAAYPVAEGKLFPTGVHQLPS